MDPTWVQFGALGIVAFVVFYLVKWLTNSLNGKLDRLTEAVVRSTEATQENTRVLRNHLRSDR